MLTDFINDNCFKIEFIEKTVKGHTYYIPKYSESRPACQALLKGAMFEPETHIYIHNFFKKNPGSMIHAGTFYGDMLPSFSEACETVYAFEPVIENYILAALTVSKNDLGNVILLNSALTREYQKVFMETGKMGSLGGASEVANKGEYQAPGVPIDSFEYDRLKMIQLDVERYEYQVLQGAQKTIEKHRPVILVERASPAVETFMRLFKYKSTPTSLKELIAYTP